MNKKLFLENVSGDLMKAKLASKFKEMLEILRLSEIVDDVHLKETPERMARMYVNELFSGCYQAPPDIKTFVDYSATPVTNIGITVKSLCAHHFVPFIGECTIYYKPKSGIITGLSKFSRVVEYFSRRPQIQENLTRQIGEYLQAALTPEELIVGMKAQHMCMTHRGVNESNPLTETYYSHFANGSENFEKIRYVMNTINIRR